MLTLHHLEQSRSIRIIWALEELGIDYDIQYYPRQPDFTAPPELKRIHPLGKSPILTDGDLTLAESAVILEYLQQTYDRQHLFKPKNDVIDQQEQSLQYLYWMHYAEGSLMPLLVMNIVLEKVSSHVPFLVKPLINKVTDGIKAGFTRPRLNEHIPYLEHYLQQHDYFAGSFSFADIQMSFPLFALEQRLKGQYPAIQRYVQRLKQREAYQRAQLKNDRRS